MTQLNLLLTTIMEYHHSQTIETLYFLFQQTVALTITRSANTMMFIRPKMDNGQAPMRLTTMNMNITENENQAD